MLPQDFSILIMPTAHIARNSLHLSEDITSSLIPPPHTHTMSASFSSRYLHSQLQTQDYREVSVPQAETGGPSLGSQCSSRIPL